MSAPDENDTPIYRSQTEGATIEDDNGNVLCCFIWRNRSVEQANAVKAYLAEQNALNPQKKGTFTICTSGDPQVYVNVGKRLGLFEASELKVVHI